MLKGPNKDNELVVVVEQMCPQARHVEETSSGPRPASTPANADHAAEGREKRTAQRNELSKLVVILPGDAGEQLYQIPTNVIDRHHLS